MKKYKLINNTLGWLIFIVAAATYLLTIEPTASFWDCPEFIAQGFKTEIGHPPGNPIFILAANFASKFAGGDVMAVAKCVNAMSAIFSALTILLLFWSITHLVKKLVVKDGEEDKMSLAQYLVVMGSGICGALAYTWSDTFWFSAVEAEVYAFSSFCTALVFWLILKWENRADEPGSDRWIVLIAYVFGVSLGVHLLNLLCIPAIALIYYYRQCRSRGKDSTLKGSILTLLISFVIVGLILYGLEPGFVEMGQKFDLFFVNTLGMSFNSGVLVYAILLILALAWALWELYSNKSDMRIKLSFAIAILLSGMLLLGDSMLIPLVLFIGLCVYLFKFCKRVPVRVFTNIVSCILVIFIGFSCYALILIRSSQNTPLDENSPNNTFALAKYLSREQYGETPLLYGRTLYSDIMYQESGNGTMQPATKNGPTQYAPEVKTSPDQPDHYKDLGPKKTFLYSPEQNMLFPRIHDDKREREYIEWLGMEGTQVQATTRLDINGNPNGTETKMKPTMMENLRFFVDYQLNYMYWRYFMWNFAGRQNDMQGMGEITHGNWISGYSFIDNPRLGDQSLLPDDLGKGNKGHNVFYLLPLIMGIIGLLWQAYRGRRGIEQFWVIFFLFFMTGIAIVLYLNQTPSQPRERDYAYAGSFYAYSIWIGMGVAGLWSLVMWALKKKDKKEPKDEAALPATNGSRGGMATAVAACAAIVGLIVPLQMVSQTWDDHDRSGRTAARDFGRNYLSSIAPNGIIFCNGDNDTFPLWYLQEVEGFRTDVRAVNLSYLATDWYINQMQRAAYESAPLPMLAKEDTYAYDQRQFCYFVQPDQTPTEALKSIAHIYGPESSNNEYGITQILYPKVYIPVDADQAVKAGVIRPEQRDMAQESINLDLQRMGSGMTSSQLMSFDMIASSIAQGWKRPCYFAMTVPNDYYLGLDPYLRLTGLAYQVTPLVSDMSRGEIGVSTDIMYDNVVNKFLWGGLDTAKPGSLYLDETVCRMVTTMRSAMIDLANSLRIEGELAKQGQQPIPAGMTAEAYTADRYKKSKTILDLMMQKLPLEACPFAVQMGEQVARIYYELGKATDDKTCIDKCNDLLKKEILRYAGYLRYYQSLSPSQYDRLTRTDKFIDQQYMIDLIGDYGQNVDEKEYEKLVNQLTAAGVNMDRLISYQKSYEQAMQQQIEAQQAAAAQQQNDEEGADELNAVLGN
jgi:ribosomal protein L12E/L44/L45/RPP1/RPP2